MKSRDEIVLTKIVQYIDEIAYTINTLKLNAESLSDNFIAKNALAMCVLQIGELVGHLSDEFKETHTDVPWHKIRAMRNIAAHNYGNFDLDVLWEVVTESVPDLKVYCQDILAEMK